MAIAFSLPVPIVRWQSIGVFPEDSKELNLSFIDPMLRRRLSPLARATLHIANACAGEFETVQVVYASRHGELKRTIELLNHLCIGEDLSPTTFGLSVLNSVPGIFSIARQDAAPATAISAAEETFGFGLIDATTRAIASGSQVLYLYADTPPPLPIPRQFGDPSDFLVSGMLIDPIAPFRLNVSTLTTSSVVTNEPQAVSFLRALANTTETTWSSGVRSWLWTPQCA